MFAGILRRFWRDPNTEFYNLKLSLLSFLLSLIEGMPQTIIEYQIFQFELTFLNQIMINSIKQLYYCIGRKDSFGKKKISDYPLTLKDYDHILRNFQSNQEFAEHNLLKIAFKILLYIKLVGGAKSNFSFFFKERNDILLLWEFQNPTVY